MGWGSKSCERDSDHNWDISREWDDGRDYWTEFRCHNCGERRKIRS